LGFATFVEVRTGLAVSDSKHEHQAGLSKTI
jgi:hypothetical protein